MGMKAWGCQHRRRLVTFMAIRNDQCYNKYGYHPIPRTDGKVGGPLNYGTIKPEDKKKIAACVDDLNKKRRLVTFMAARNGQCYNKYGYHVIPRTDGKVGGPPNYGTIKPEDKKKIAACIDDLNKPKVAVIQKRRLVTFMAARNGKCYRKYGYHAK